MIRQVRVSHGLRRFKKGLMERWNLADYHDRDAPCLFFNINGEEDINAVKNHKGFKLIFFGNARGNQFIKSFVGLKNLVVIGNAYLDVPEGIKVKDTGNPTPFEIKDYSMFTPCKLGDKIYSYIGNDRQKHKYGYEQLCEIQKKIDYKIIMAKNEHSIEFVKHNFYETSFLNLNLNRSGGGGLTTMRELALMGRKTIMNTKFDYPCIIPYKDENDIIRIINEEAKKIGTVQPGKDYHTTGKEWRNVSYWVNETIDIDKLLCNRAAFLTNEGYGSKPMNYFPFYTACKMYMANQHDEGKKIYYYLIKHFFNIYGKKHMREGGIKGFWWYDRIMKFPTLEEGIMWWVYDRFNLLESIAREYNPYREEIVVREDNGKYYISDGHHRVAILYALGYKKVENVRIK